MPQRLDLFTFLLGIDGPRAVDHEGKNKVILIGGAIAD